jgi:hypothetical protein
MNAEQTEREMRRCWEWVCAGIPNKEQWPTPTARNFKLETEMYRAEGLAWLARAELAMADEAELREEATRRLEESFLREQEKARPFYKVDKRAEMLKLRCAMPAGGDAGAKDKFICEEWNAHNELCKEAK